MPPRPFPPILAAAVTLALAANGGARLWSLAAPLGLNPGQAWALATVAATGLTAWLAARALAPRAPRQAANDNLRGRTFPELR